jgi:SAM-dependent methyltransferase
MSEQIIRDEDIQAFYDSNTKRKIIDFIEGNDRVERAWQTLVEWSPKSPKRILEIGCSIGYISWRMSKLWQKSEVIGLDVSPKTLEIAIKLFASSRLSFVEGPLLKGKIEGKFDLVVMIDVYEHIKLSERPKLHGALQELLEDSGRIFLAFPTMRHLEWLREHNPSEIQPVDEDVDVQSMIQLAKDTNSEVLLYKDISVWNEGDYAHAVIGKRNVDWGYCTGKTSLANEMKKSVKIWISEMSVADKNRIFPSKKTKLKMIHEKLGKDAL